MYREFRREARLMGSAFEFIIVAAEARGEALLDKCMREVERIERLLTEFGEHSDTARLNRAAGAEAIAVGPETYALLERCAAISRLSQGAFDISAGALKKLYNFKGGTPTRPSSEALKAALQKVGFQHVRLLENRRVCLEKQDMHISFAAIGKGYAADRVKSLLQTEEGVKSAVINASGDLTAWGVRPDGSPWKVGIADPNDPARILLWLPVDGVSVATSGDYEQFFEREGVRYSHNIDPKTGLPVSGVKSVTVASPSAELSDALATAVFVMGAEAGLHLIAQLPQTHCIFIDSGNKVHVSKHLKIK